MATQVAEDWYRLQWEIVLAKHYPQAQSLFSARAVAFKNPIVESLLPTLLYVRMIAVLDDALERYIDNEGWTVPKPYRNDLHGRISFLGDKGKVSDPAAFHRLRDRRNALAHESNQESTWTELETDHRTIHAQLQRLGIVGEFPAFEFFGERKSRGRPPASDAVMTEYDVTFGVRLGESSVVELHQVETVYKVGRKPAGS